MSFGETTAERTPLPSPDLQNQVHNKLPVPTLLYIKLSMERDGLHKSFRGVSLSVAAAIPVHPVEEPHPPLDIPVHA
jgi:hypothetical protein